MNAATIRLSNVSKRFGGVEAARGISIELGAGETVALVGHNGAGKTTLMKLMLGLIRPNTGDVRVLGDDPAAGEFLGRRELGYLPENVSFSANLSGRETLAFYGRLKRQPRAAQDALLDRVGLTDAADRRVGTYSKGMRQRLGLAQALLGDPRVLLLDEPTSGLDPALRQSFYDIVDEFRARGAIVLISSHALTELEERAGRIIVMNQGIKVADGSIGQLRDLARLPTRVRLKMASSTDRMPAWLNQYAGWRRINGQFIEIDALPENKLSLLHCATGKDAAVDDLEVMPPTLDELYAHFLRAQEAAT